MTIRSGVFRSVDGDRKYTADFFRSYFASFIGNGVFPNPSTNLQAFPGQGLTTQVRPGKAWISGAYMESDDNFVITHPNPNPSLSRIDRIIVGLNTETRTMNIYLKVGTPSTNPQPQPVLRTASVYELALADITIVPTTTSIQSNNIRDLRMNTDVCGFVTGLVQQVDTTTLFNQYQSALLEFETVQEADFLQWSNERRQEFEEWYASLQDTLQGDVAANLLQLINANSEGLLEKADKQYVDNRLAEKADQSFVDSQFASIVSGAPKGTFSTLAALQASYPNGTDGIFLVLADGHWYYWNQLQMEWLDGGVYQATSIPDESVTPMKTTFFEISTNLYDSSTTTPNKNVNPTTGAVVDSAVNSLSDFISITPNTIYSTTPNKAHTVAFYTQDRTFISRPYTAPGAFTTPSNAYYLRLIMNATDVYVVQLNLGSTLLPYEPYYKPIIEEEYLPIVNGEKIVNESINLDKLGFLSNSSNLYDSSTITPNKNFDANNGSLIDSAVNSVSDFIPIKPSTTYTVYGIHTIAYFTQGRTFISRPYTAPGTFTTPSNAYYARVVMSNINVLVAQLNEGDTLLPYESYYRAISLNALPPKVAEKVEPKSYYFSPEEIVDPYKSKLNSFTGFANSNDYYQAFNDLANNYSDYLTGELLGKDQSNTYDIYSYTAKPTQLTGASSIRKKLPKLVFSVGLHGEEKTSIYAIYYLIKDICENWQTDKFLEYLRWNVELVFIPLANPYGFSEGIQRHNSRGVDLNRNMPYLWEPLSGNEYSGTGPLSEKEAQYLAQLIESNTDALAFGDYHSNGSTANYSGYDRLMWFSLQNYSSGLYDENISITARYTVEKMTREYTKDYNFPNNVGYFGYLTETLVRGGAKTYASHLGIPSCTFETCVKLPFETGLYSQQTVRVGTELLGNWILNLINYYKIIY